MIEHNLKTVKIGDQTWMAENLSLDDGGEGIYHHGGQVYYTWDAAVRVCSNLKGWHLPSREEWKTLIKNCGGVNKAGKALKSASGWKADGNGTDAFGFSALPVGYRLSIGGYDGEGYDAYFWSSTEYDSYRAYYMLLDYGGDTALLLNYKNIGFSVRCLKD